MNRVALKIILMILIFIVCIFCFTALFFYLYMVNTPNQENGFSLTFYIFAIITAIGIITIVGLIISLLPKEQKPSVVSKEQLSYFDGKILGWIGHSFLLFFVSLLSLGWAYPWARCVFESWKAEHTVINGKRLKFKGKVKDLFVNHLIWSLLTSVTFGFYGLLAPLEFEKWKAEQIYSEPDTGVKQKSKPRTKAVIIALIILAVELGALIFLVIMFYSAILAGLATLPIVGALFAS